MKFHKIFVSLGCIYPICYNLAIGNSDTEKPDLSNTEILKQFEIFLNNKKQDKTTKAEPAKQVKDKNFELIEQLQDDLQKIFNTSWDTLAKKPTDISIELKCILDFIRGHKDIGQTKEAMESIEKAISEFLEQFQDITNKIQVCLALLRTLDLTTDKTFGIIDILKKMDNAKPIATNAAESISNNVGPMLRYYPETLQNRIRTMFTGASKTNFDNRPNVPSYYLIHLFSIISEQLQKLQVGKAPALFCRIFEETVYQMQKLIEDIGREAKSDQSAPNVIPFLENEKKTVTLLLDSVKKTSKEWKEYISTISTVDKDVRERITEFIKVEKDQSIFEYVDKGPGSNEGENN